MTMAEFIDAIKVLRGIDADDLPAWLLCIDGAAGGITRRPIEYFIASDDRTQAAIWAIVTSRMGPPG
ncbi:MAG: hypothetical protein ACREEP_21920 [Dongiaceae bacterium]